MKEEDAKLTLQETEQLCRLYMECRLTVLEETELQYVLGKLPYSSPCIDEVRMLMGIAAEPKSNTPAKKKSGFMRSKTIIGIAASLALLLVASVALFDHGATTTQSGDGFYIAYANGEKVGREQTVKQVTADMRAADEFLSHIAELEAQEQIMVDNFINQISPEQ